MSDNIPVSPLNYHRPFEDENNQIIDAALEFAHEANEGYARTRTATDGMVLEVTLRSLRELDDQPFSVRRHLTLTDVSHFMSLLQKNKAITASVKNTDILPIAHPRSTQMHMLDIDEYIAATARWIADDPSIKDDSTRAMVASMLTAPEGSAEREYYQTRLENLPQGEVPIRALVAAFKLGANKGFWRFQRRDRKGRFAWMGGGISALVRGTDGTVRRLTGRTVSAGGSEQTGDATFDMEISPGRLARVPAASSEASKAYLASPDAVDGMSPIKARVQSGDEVLDISQVEYPEAPSGFTKVGRGEATPAAPSRLKKSVSAEEIQNIKENSIRDHAVEKGRFPLARGAVGSIGETTDIAEGAKRDYKKTYDLLSEQNPDIPEAGSFNEAYSDFDSFWGKVQEYGVDEATRAYDSVSPDPEARSVIPEEMKVFNRAYAESVLGLDPNGEVTLYRNAINRPSSVEQAGTGYWSTDRDFAQDYGATQAKVGEGLNGFYEGKFRPEQIGGMLGYSRTEDEFAVVIGPDAAAEEGRVKKIAEISPPELPDFLLNQDRGDGRFTNSEDLEGSRRTGGSAFRFNSLAGAMNFSKVDNNPMGDGTLQDFFDANGITKEDWPARYDALYGEGSYAEAKEAGNNPSFQDLKKAFVQDEDGKWFLDVARIDNPNAQGLISPSYGEGGGDPNTWKNDSFDSKMKMLGLVQDITGEEFMSERQYDAPDAEEAPAATTPGASPAEIEYYGEDADFGETFTDGNYTIRKFDVGSSPVAKDNFELAREAEKSCGLTAAVGDDGCPISVDGAGPDGSLDPEKPVLFTNRSADSDNPDIFSVTQSWADAVRDTRQDEARYIANEPPSPNKKTAGAEANDDRRWAESAERNESVKKDLERLDGPVPSSPEAQKRRSEIIREGFEEEKRLEEERIREKQKSMPPVTTPNEDAAQSLDDAPVGSRVLVTPGGPGGFGGPGPARPKYAVKQEDGTWRDEDSGFSVSNDALVKRITDEKARIETPRSDRAPEDSMRFPGSKLIPDRGHNLWIPGIPMGEAAARMIRPRRRRGGGFGPPGVPGTGRRWDSAGPSQGHAPYPIPGRRVYPGEIADMRIGSEMEQSLGGFLATLFGIAEKRQLRKIGANEWVDLRTGKTYTNDQVSEMAATKGQDRSPFTGLATGPEVRAGTFTKMMSNSLFKELPIGTELNDHLRLFNVMTQFRKIGYNQWRRWDGKIFTDAEVQAKSGTMQIDRVGEFGPGTPPAGRAARQASKPRLPRGPLTPEEMAALGLGSLVSVAGEGDELPRFFEKVGENEWREIDPENSMPDPLVPFTDEDIINIGRDITLEKEPEQVAQGQPGMRPSDLSPEALENLPTGTVVGNSDEEIENFNLPRREPYRTEEAYQEALEEAKAFFRSQRWRKRGPNEWVNDFGEFATDADIADGKKTPGRIISLGDEFSTPEGYYDLNREELYTPTGASEGQTSPDFTDDPSELAQRFSEEDLKAALKEALEDPNGFGYLGFEEGDEPLPAEALYYALVRKLGVDVVDKFVSDVYGQGRAFEAERELSREFPDILSDDPNKRQAALIEAWNSQWGRSKFALDRDGNFTVVGKDNDSVATQYLLDKIKEEEWGDEFFKGFGEEYGDVLNDVTKAEIKALYDGYPGLSSEDPEERKSAVRKALEDFISDDEYVKDENGNTIEVNPRSAVTKLLWDMAQEFIGTTSSPVGRKDEGSLPPVIDGASDEEKAEFEKTGDYTPFLPKDNPESFENVWNNYYNPLPEPYITPEDKPETNPVNLARRFTPDQLKEQLREAILDGSGYGVVAFESPSGEPVEVRVPAEALRDALQLQGENANDFIQSVFNDNLPPARQTQQLLDEIADLKTRRDAEENRTEKGKLTRQINKKTAEVGMRYKAIEALRKREAQLDRLSKQSRLSDEERQQVLDKLEQVRARREQEEGIFNGDLERGESMTPFEENVDAELEKLDFEQAPTRRPTEPTTTDAPTTTEADKPKPVVSYKRVGNKVFIRQRTGRIITNNPEFKEFIKENGFVYDSEIDKVFEIADMNDDEFNEFMRTVRDQFDIDLQPEKGQKAIDFDSPSTTDPRPAPKPSELGTSPNTASVIESLQRRIEVIKKYIQERILPLLRSDVESENREGQQLNRRAENVVRKIKNRISRHQDEAPVGQDARDPRILNVRPTDYKVGDVFVDDLFTIDRIEISERIKDPQSPYYGERDVIYFGHYPGGVEQEKRRPENFRTDGVYRGLEAPEGGDLPALNSPKGEEYLPEAVRNQPRGNLEQIEREPLNGRERRALYGPKQSEFPEEHDRFLRDYEQYEADLAERMTRWSPPPVEGKTEDQQPTPRSDSRVVTGSDEAQNLQPGDITYRENPDGSLEFFVVQSIENRQVKTGTRTGTRQAPEGAEGVDSETAQAAFDEAVAREPGLADEDPARRKRAYAKIIGEFYAEAQQAGQARKEGKDYVPLEGPLGDRFRWLLSQRDRVLAGEPLSPEGVTPGETGEVEEDVFEEKTFVTGYHPGHEAQEKSWKPTTPISYVRGETDLPPAGEKPSVPGKTEIYAATKDRAERARMLAEREAALAESSKLYSLGSAPQVNSVPTEVKSPNAFMMIGKFAPAFFGKKILDLVRGKTGKEIKEELKSKRVVFLDFESVGKGFERRVPDAPIQVAAVVYENGQEVDRKVLFINPGERLGGYYYEAYPKRDQNAAPGDVTPGKLPNGSRVGQIVGDDLLTYTRQGTRWINDADSEDALDTNELKNRSGDILKLNEEGQPILRENRLRDSEGNPITDEFLSSQKGLEESFRELIDFIGEDAYLSAFNADFDINLLDRFAERFGLDFRSDGFIDPLALARALNPDDSVPNNLASVATRYGIIRDPDDWHNAEIDVEVLPELLDKMLDEVTPDNAVLDVDKRAAEYENGVRRYLEQLEQWEAQEGISAPEFRPLDTPEAAPAPARRPKKSKKEQPSQDSPPDEDVSAVTMVTKLKTNPRSIFGDTINEEWVTDDENTIIKSAGTNNVRDLRVGDFFGDQNGEYNELLFVETDPITKSETFTYRNVNTGQIFRAFGAPNSKVQVGTNEMPLRRRAELDGLSNPEILDLLRRKLRGDSLNMAVPQLKFQDGADREIAAAIDDFINQGSEESSVSDSLGGRVTSELHIDKNGFALAEGDMVYDPKTGTTHKVVRTLPLYKPSKQSPKEYFNYVRISFINSKGQADSKPMVSSKLELINPPAQEEALSPLSDVFGEKVVAGGKAPEVTDPIITARKIERLMPYLNPGPGYIRQVGNAIKAAIKAYRNNDFATAERFANAAEDYADSLEAPRVSLEDIKNQVAARARGLAGLIQLPETGPKAREAFAKAVGLYNKGRYSQARRQLDRTEDFLWNEAEQARASVGRSPQTAVRKFIDGVADLESALDAPLSRDYFARILRDAKRNDYDFENKEEIIQEALQAIRDGFVVPGYQVLERLARTRERQLDQKNPKRKELGAESYAERLTAEINSDIADKPGPSADEMAETGAPKEAVEEQLEKVVNTEGRRGLFYTDASSIQERDIVLTDAGVGTVIKRKDLEDGSVELTVTASRAVLDADGNEIDLVTSYRKLTAQPEDEILLLQRSAKGDAPLPQRARNIGGSEIIDPNYSEVEGFTKPEVVDEEEGELDNIEPPTVLNMALPGTSPAEDVNATPEQASIMDAIAEGVKRIKVLAFAGSGKTTSLKMAAKSILKKDPKAKILMVMFNVSLKEETAAKMPKGVEVRTSGSLAFQALDPKLKQKLREQGNTAKFPDMATSLRQEAKELGIQGPRKLKINGSEEEMSANSVAREVKKAATKFSYSAEEQIGPEHFDEKFDEVPAELVALAQEYFDKAVNTDGNIKLENHHIVKLWSLSKPDLTKFGSGVWGTGADYLFFDEAQDINPAVEKVISDQQNFKSMVWVGDSRQAIYQFMGAVDALKRFTADRVLALTQSFRFGPEVAGIANRVLSLLGETRKIKGSGPSGEIIEGMDNPTIVISRTNPGGLAALSNFINQGKLVAIDEDALLEYTSLLDGISFLRARNNDPGLARPATLHPQLVAYDDYSQLLEEKKEGMLGGGASAMLNILQQFRESPNDIGALRELISQFSVVRDIPTAKRSEDYVALDYDDIEPGSVVQINSEAEQARRRNSAAFAWVAPDGTVYARAFGFNNGQGAIQERQALHAYFKSIGFKWNPDADIDPSISEVDRIRAPKEGKGAYEMVDGSPLNLDENGRWILMNQIRKYANNYFQTPETPISFTTAHKAKGREWQRVLIAGDFPKPDMDEETLEWKLPSEEELNLIYVAVTRAIKGLDLGSLSWILDETTDDDAIYRQPSPEESALNMAIPQRSGGVTRVRFVEQLDEADKALTAQTKRVLDEIKKAIASDETPPWVAPWQAKAEKQDMITTPGFSVGRLPTSVTTGKAYSGSNLLYLQAVAKNNGWSDSRWITQAEIDKRGGKVKKGQLPTRMTAWLPNYTTIVDDDGNELETVFSVSPEDHFVYNVEQVDKLNNLGRLLGVASLTPSEAENAVLASYTDAPSVVNREYSFEDLESGRASANYVSQTDTVTMPPRESFPSDEKYFEALAHELIHSTGSAQRLNRDSVTFPGGRGSYSSKNYNEMEIEEEFIAQIGTAILASRLGINLDLPNLASYMKAWQDQYGENPDRMVRAAKKAQDAADYILRGRGGGDFAPQPEAELPDDSVVSSERWQLALPAEPIRMAVPSEGTTPSNFSNEVSETRSKTQEISQKVTDMVVQAIKDGKQLPWNKPWTDNNIFSMPYSVTSNKPYKGSNIVALWVASMVNDWSDNRWITFNEAKKRGGTVKKGSKGTQIVNWSPVIKKVEQDDGSTKDEVAFMRPSVYTVFNVEQTEGVEGLPEPELFEPVPITEAEQAALSRYADAPPISNKMQDAAFWRPSTDEIIMPLREQFANIDGYVSTLFHELVHSTGHSSRLDRTDLGDKYATHNDARGEEELIAEIGSAILAARLGLELNLEQTAAYAQSWLRALENDPDMITKAAQRADAAVGYILGDESYKGEAGRTGEERAADLEDSSTTPEAPNLGEQGVPGENND